MRHGSTYLRQQVAGFTLVELLVALVVLGFILAAVAGGIRFGNRAWETSAVRSAAIEDVAVAQRFLRHRLGEVMTLSADIGGTPRQIGVTGDATHLRFTAPWLSPVGSGGLYLFEIGRTTNRSLGLGWTLLHPELAEASGPRRDGERNLLTEIESVNIRYFGDLDFADTPGWQTSWTDPVFPPRLVAIDISFAADDPRSWPTLIVAPHALAVDR
jgi:general secretion pathway protein J